MFKLKHTLSSPLSFLERLIQQCLQLHDDLFLLTNGILVETNLLHFFVQLRKGAPQLIMLLPQALQLGAHSFSLGKVNVGTLESFLEVLIPNALRPVGLR